MMYEDYIANCISTTNPLSQWYLLEDEGNIIGCAGLITNDLLAEWIYILGFVHCTFQRSVLMIEKENLIEICTAIYFVLNILH